MCCLDYCASAGCITLHRWTATAETIGGATFEWMAESSASTGWCNINTGDDDCVCVCVCACFIKDHWCLLWLVISSLSSNTQIQFAAPLLKMPQLMPNVLLHCPHRFYVPVLKPNFVSQSPGTCTSTSSLHYSYGVHLTNHRWGHKTKITLHVFKI